jgi:hypothetical protein
MLAPGFFRPLPRVVIPASCYTHPLIEPRIRFLQQLPDLACPQSPSDVTDAPRLSSGAKYRPVKLALDFAIVSGVPCAMI